MSKNVKPELMSPAGHWPELRAAIEAGADAVYFGLKHFSARAKVGFALDELPEVMRTLHRRSVKGFVTFNTLTFDSELPVAEKALMRIADAGVDAVIVQDIGIAQMVQTVAPDLDVHGSTQMSITSAQGAELARSLGCSRVVLGRELSLSDIRKIASETEVELETFVHGALCVSYSGQCFSSEAWGGRSANRGKCAQACRLSYDLIVDGQQRDLGEYRYLLSPGDLCALGQIPELIDIGIACLKIEGRYKDAAYVALTTQAYRQAIDAAVAGMSLPRREEIRDQLEQVYSRGLGPHFMSGVDHQKVVIGRAPRHRGICVGRVTDVGSDHVLVQPNRPIHAGDGLVFDAADWRSPDQPEEGGHVYRVDPRNSEVILRFARREIDFNRIRIGDLVWRTRDPKLDKIVKPLLKTEKPIAVRPILFEIRATVGERLRVSGKLASGLEAVFESTEPLANARSQTIDSERIESQLSRLGGTPFFLERAQLAADPDVFIPVSQLNEARRHIVQSLIEQLERVTTPPERRSFLDLARQPDSLAPESRDAQLHLLVRTPEQLDGAIHCHPASITLDYLELYGLRPSVEKIRDAGLTARVASPRILKPSEQNVIRFLLSLNCQILVRSGGLLFDLAREQHRPNELIGDFSLNVANRIAADLLLDMGLTRLTPTYDLNAKQIHSLAQYVPGDRLEVIAYSHLPVFHTEHCVFCRFLSSGTDHTNCGHPCEQHRIAVKDADGRQHPVMADVGCRNTVFGAEAQTDPTSITQWRSAGIHHFRLEFVHQSRDQVITISESFRRFLSSEIGERELSTALQSASPQGITTGSLFVPRKSELIQLN